MDNGLIQIKCAVDTEIIDVEKILSILPKWKTQITQAEVVGEGDLQLQLKLLIAAYSVEDITQWLAIFEENTKSTYSVKSTEKCSGRYVVFKQRRYCQHNTKCERTYDPLIRGNTRNTNCPSKITITLRAIKNRHRCRNDPPDAEFPCQIELIATHNHNIGTPNELRFRTVSDDVKTKLKKLYEIGHSPATAREMIRTEICLQHDDYEQILTDRKYYPDYQFCYYMYKVFKEENDYVDFDSKRKEHIAKMINEHNIKNGDNDVQIMFEDNDYVICICPPLMKRVHENIQFSSQTVLLDSCGTLNNSQIFVLTTHSECGSLPLGVIITSCDSTNLLIRGLQLLQHMVGDAIFYGHVEGPKMFLTNDSYPEMTAIKSVWPKSETYLCPFDVLQEVWKWLTKAKNGVPHEFQYSYFRDFKSVVFATTTKDCSEKFTLAKNNAKAYSQYCRYVDEYWDRRKLWAMCYRNNICDYSGSCVKFLKEKIFHTVRNFNVVQMLHFILTYFVEYYKLRLLDGAQNQLHKHSLSRPFSAPPEGLIQKVQRVADNIVTIPSDNEENVHTVNLDVLTCTCFNGNTVRFCKHVDWICCLVFAQSYVITLNDISMCSTYYKVATGTDPPIDCLLTLHGDSDNYMVITDLNSAENYIISNADSSYLSYNIEKISEDVFISQGKKMIEEIGKAFEQFLQASPQEAFPALEAMKKKMYSLDTVSSFASSCYSFGNDFIPNDLSLQDNSVISYQKADSEDVCQKPRTLILKVGGKAYLLPKRTMERLENR